MYSESFTGNVKAGTRKLVTVLTTLFKMYSESFTGNVKAGTRKLVTVLH